MPRKSTVRKEGIRNKLCELWGRILIKSIPTSDIFKEIGYDYEKVNDRDMIYRYNSELQKEAEVEFHKFTIETGDKEVIYKKWLDWCYLNKTPYIIFDNGFAMSPKTYREWEKILENNCLRQIFGARKSMERMVSKGMEIRKLPSSDLIGTYDHFLENIPDKEELEDELEEI